MGNDFFSGMQAVQKIAVESVEESLNSLKEGITEIAFEKKLNDLMESKGVDGKWYPSLIYFSNRTVNASKKFLPSETKLKKGDIVSIGVHPTKDRFMGDYSIATIFGENKGLQELVGNAKEIESKTIKFASAKTTGKELFSYCFELINEFGYSLLDLRENIGHTVGKMPADDSKFQRKFLNRENNETLEGKFWTIEPFLGSKGFGAVFEDIIHINKNEKKTLG